MASSLSRSKIKIREEHNQHLISATPSPSDLAAGVLIRSRPPPPPTLCCSPLPSPSLLSSQEKRREVKRREEGARPPGGGGHGAPTSAAPSDHGAGSASGSSSTTTGRQRRGGPSFFSPSCDAAMEGLELLPASPSLSPVCSFRFGRRQGSLMRFPHTRAGAPLAALHPLCSDPTIDAMEFVKVSHPPPLSLLSLSIMLWVSTVTVVSLLPPPTTVDAQFACCTTLGSVGKPEAFFREAHLLVCIFLTGKLLSPTDSVDLLLYLYIWKYLELI